MLRRCAPRLAGLAAGLASSLWAPPLAAADGAGPDRYARAAAAYRAGDAATARADVEALLSDDPDNSDALLLAGTLDTRAGRFAQATAALDRAVAVAPGYADVFAARARLNLLQGRRIAARADATRALGLSPENREAALVLAELRTPLPRPALSTGLTRTVSRLSQGRGTWYETAATLSVRRSGSSLALEVEHARRGAARDTRFELRADAASGRGTVYGAAVATVEPDFREHWGLRAGADYPLSNRLDALVDLRYSNFGHTDSASASTGLRVWLAGRRASIRGAMIHLIDENRRYRIGFSLAGLAQIGSAVTVQSGFARYPETDAGVTRQVATLFAGLSFTASRELTLRASVEHEVRAGAYRRDGLTAGAALSF